MHGHGLLHGRHPVASRSGKGSATSSPGQALFVLFRRGREEEGVRELESAVGDEVPEFRNPDQAGVHTGAGLWFRRLGAAAVHALPGIVATLSPAGAIEAVEANRFALFPRGAAANIPQETSGEPESAWWLNSIGLPNSRRGTGVRILLPDSGVAVNHPGLTDKACSSVGFCGPDSVPQPGADASGHGTQCAGLILDSRWGVAPEAELLAAAVGLQATDCRVLAALEWGLEQGCRIASLSLATTRRPADPHSRCFEAVARRCRQHGMLIFAAVGQGRDMAGRRSPMGHPADCPAVVAIAATDREGRPWTQNALGVGTPRPPDFYAPGVGLATLSRDGGDCRISGTSAATALAAGVAALWCEAFPQDSADGILDRMRAAAHRQDGIPGSRAIWAIRAIRAPGLADGDVRVGGG